MHPYRENLIFNRRIFGTCMRFEFTLLTAVLIIGTLSAKAQNKGTTEAELMRYTIATDSLKKLTDQFKEASLKIGNDPKITVARQQQLAQTQGDSVKLVQIKATAYERSYLKRVSEKRKQETARFREIYQSLITDYVGDNTFSKVQAQLKTDRKLKHQFDSIMLTLQRKTP